MLYFLTKGCKLSIAMTSFKKICFYSLFTINSLLLFGVIKWFSVNGLEERL